MPQKKQILEGSQAIALVVKNIDPAVVSAYPITPQTHIVEDLAKFKDETFSEESKVEVNTIDTIETMKELFSKKKDMDLVKVL